MDREKLTRIISFAIGFDLQLESKRERDRLWKLFEHFPDEDAARIYLEKQFWPNGPVCPRCGSRNHIGSGTNPYRCNACDRQFTVRTGTIFERSHIRLHRWLWAIVILASARRKVASTKLAALIQISQPAASRMIRKLKDIWRSWMDTTFELLHGDLGFAEFPITGNWPFFSGRPRVSRGSSPEYALKPEEILPGLLDRSPEKKAEEEAIWKSKEQVRKAEDWARRLKKGLKSAKRFAGLLALWKKRQQAHIQDHQEWIPFKWMTRRDCPACRFGEHEWRHWEAIAVQLDLVLWEEFWDWIEDMNQQAKWAKESAELSDEYESPDTIAPFDEEEVRREWNNRLAEVARRRAENHDPDVMI